MRSIFIATLASCVASQIFEPADFNVTKALIAQGVNVSALPQLASLVERSSDRGCDIAVSTSNNSGVQQTSNIFHSVPH